MWLVRQMRLVSLVWYIVVMYWIDQISCLNNRILMASRSNSRALSIPYDIAETLGVENQVNEPYRFSYKVQDNADNMQFRYEEKSLDGQVKGSYGYKDANNIYRMVNYYSDATGFHAKIISNEPGIIPKRDHSVNSINRELFAKQTPLAYNPANVEWIVNANQPDFSQVNTMASEYNGDWRYNNDLSAPLAREHYAFNGGDQYAGAASQVIESRRLNSANSLYANAKQKLSLLVVPKSDSNQVSSADGLNFRTSPVNPTLLNKPTIHQPADQAIQSIAHQPSIHQPVQSIVQSQPVRPQLQLNKQQPQVQPVMRRQPVHPQSVHSNQSPQQPQAQQVVRKERRRITGVRRVMKKTKEPTYFNSKIEIDPSNGKELQREGDNLSLKEFSTRFPEKWHQIFSGKTFGNNFEDKSNHYAQLDAVAARPDISVLADQSFMKQPASVVKKEISLPKQTLNKRTDRVGALPRKSVQYQPPLSSETLLTSATINAAEHHPSSPQMIPRMMNPPTTPTATRVQPLQSLTPTTLSPPIDHSSSSELTSFATQAISSANPPTTTLETTKEDKTTSTTMSPITMATESMKQQEVSMQQVADLKKDQLTKQEDLKQETTTELPMSTSTSVSVVTSTSIDHHKMNSFKSTISPIHK